MSNFFNNISQISNQAAEKMNVEQSTENAKEELEEGKKRSREGIEVPLGIEALQLGLQSGRLGLLGKHVLSTFGKGAMADLEKTHGHIKDAVASFKKGGYESVIRKAANLTIPKEKLRSMWKNSGSKAKLDDVLSKIKEKYATKEEAIKGLHKQFKNKVKSLYEQKISRIDNSDTKEYVPYDAKKPASMDEVRQKLALEEEDIRNHFKYLRNQVKSDAADRLSKTNLDDFMSQGDDLGEPRFANRSEDVDRVISDYKDDMAPGETVMNPGPGTQTFRNPLDSSYFGDGDTWESFDGNTSFKRPQDAPVEDMVTKDIETRAQHPTYTQSMKPKTVQLTDMKQTFNSIEGRQEANDMSVEVQSRASLLQETKVPSTPSLEEAIASTQALPSRQLVSQIRKDFLNTPQDDKQQSAQGRMTVPEGTPLETPSSLRMPVIEPIERIAPIEPSVLGEYEPIME